jgi:AbrB family looped-hinge helix DNA binding protein
MKDLKCSCGGKAKRVKDIEYKGFTLEGWRCEKCGEELVDPHQANLYLKYAKLRKEGKLKVKVRKVGNSFTISIPAVLRELLGLKGGEELSLELSKEGVIAKIS